MRLITNISATATTFNESGGCEPQFAMKFTRRTVGMTDGEDTYFDVYCKAAQDYMRINNTDALPDCFVSAPEIRWQDRIKTQAIMQRHVDTAISSTVNLPNSATKEDIAKLYIMAWDQGLKGVTIFRDGCKRMPILSTKKESNKSTEKDASKQSQADNTLPRGFILDASDNLVGKKRKLQTGCGSLHCTAFFDPDTGDLMETYLSRGSTGGCANSYTGLSRMISLSARAGVDINTIVDQLDSCGVCPSYYARRITKHDTSPGSSCPVAIGKALKDMWQEMQDDIADEIVSGDDKPVNNKAQNSIKNEPTIPVVRVTVEYCPECGEPLQHEGGCDICKNCGYSHCG